ncbi:MAG: helix-turn-helix domain-containing protein [Opitutaceae bacterium]|nr:helix-turn-helix domain-containing protein [Opitutaceae bacterium]
MEHPDLLEAPERAIRAFEKLSGLQVVVHDLASTLSPFLQPERFKHHSACCAAIKARHDWACVDFEIDRLRREIVEQPEGRYHRCHAGFVEWVTPVLVEGRIAWILFAGQRRATGRHRRLVHDIRATAAGETRAASLRTVGADEAEALLEALRQLRARLLEWHGHAKTLLDNMRSGRVVRMADMADRRGLILGFIHRHHAGEASLVELARTLYLGESRTSHLVKALFGRSYMELLNEQRLRTAASLLRDSSLSVLEVSLASGFKDLSNFHRRFRRRFGTTPLKYSRMART